MTYVSKVSVEGTAKSESFAVVVKGGVYGTVGAGDVLVLQPGKQLLRPPQPLCSPLCFLLDMPM